MRKNCNTYLLDRAALQQIVDANQTKKNQAQGLVLMNAE